MGYLVGMQDGALLLGLFELLALLLGVLVDHLLHGGGALLGLLQLIERRGDARLRRLGLGRFAAAAKQQAATEQNGREADHARLLRRPGFSSVRRRFGQGKPIV
jgi:hypothetical protein